MVLWTIDFAFQVDGIEEWINDSRTVLAGDDAEQVIKVTKDSVIGAAYETDGVDDQPAQSLTIVAFRLQGVKPGATVDLVNVQTLLDEEVITLTDGHEDTADDNQSALPADDQN